MILAWGVFFIQNGRAVQRVEAPHLKVVWSAAGINQDLKDWAISDLQRLKRVSSREKDPTTGKIVQWDGILLSQFIEKVLADLPNEKSAQIDLVILKSLTGESALIPRALVSKYPMMLALDWNGMAKDSRGPIYSVVPWTSKSRIMNEDLPLEKYFIPQVSKIELTNYRDRYSDLFLKRRTDPSAMRGEKLFVQNCVSCHSGGHGSDLGAGLNAVLMTGIAEKQHEKKFVSAGHPPTKGTSSLSDRDRKSVVRYIDAFRSENPVSVSTLKAQGQSL
jgi:hypothetical protein